jgi:hypothetical protein
LGFLALGVLIAAAASAQTGTSSSAIAGVVKDTSGAVLPGVTVEAASPALIEKVRTVVTDDQGQYKIVNLPVGSYSLTFSLSGFRSVKREGIQLVTNFTAPVNGELAVGAIEETVTVSGAAPVVDVRFIPVLDRRHLRRRAVLQREHQPTSRLYARSQPAGDKRLLGP